MKKLCFFVCLVLSQPAFATPNTHLKKPKKRSGSSDLLYIVGLPHWIPRQCTEDVSMGIGPTRYMKGHTDRDDAQIKICQVGSGYYSKNAIAVVRDKNWFPSITIGRKNSIAISPHIDEVAFVCSLDEAKIPKTPRVVFPTVSELESKGIRIEIPCNIDAAKVRIAMLDAKDLIEGTLKNLKKTASSVSRNRKHECTGDASHPACKEWTARMASVMSGEAVEPIPEVARFRCLEVNAGLGTSYAYMRKSPTIESTAKKKWVIDGLDMSVEIMGVTNPNEFFRDEYIEWIENKTPSCSIVEPSRDDYSKCLSELTATKALIGELYDDKECFDDGSFAPITPYRAVCFVYDRLAKSEYRYAEETLDSLVTKEENKIHDIITSDDFNRWMRSGWDQKSVDEHDAKRAMMETEGEKLQAEIRRYEAKVREYASSYLVRRSSGDASYQMMTRRTIREVCATDTACSIALRRWERQRVYFMNYPEGCWKLGIQDRGGILEPILQPESQIHCDNEFGL